MIELALRSASELHGRSVCLPCFLRISNLFYRSQLRNYAATAQSTAAELGPEDGGDGVQARPLKDRAAFRRVRSIRNHLLAPPRLRIRPAPRASPSRSSIGDRKRTLEAQTKALESKDASAGVTGHPGLRGGASESTSIGESGVSKGRVKKPRKKGPSIKKSPPNSKKTAQMGVPYSSALPHNSTIEEALSGRISSSRKTDPSLTRKGTTPGDIRMVDPSTLNIEPVDGYAQPPVPSLSYGLERVLFNPGVYHLQDPRSRVYNFDPYLQTIMPVAEFNYDALKEYITSSRDKSLRSLAKEQGKKYVGSSSSMTGALAHFHFLFSHWRQINTQYLSQGFPAKLKSFTALQRSPSAIFLRWDGDSYAVDADKEFDSANVLSFLGKSMEKLLTLPTHEFERYRKSGPGRISEEERDAPESYHYCKIGDFLLRSQLDAHDSRLPGTGMFDVKTRAAVSIRMNAQRYHDGLGYEIKGQYGEWESYEREYFDMIRAAFLKYSLQVRMGRMDGIFVAFHNVERIFGFQYVSLPEMDSTLHGTTDTTTGDLEFKLSLDLLNKILDRATTKYPGKSLRIHFETRETQTPFMYIFAEPVSEEQIMEIQATNQAKVEAFERKIFGLSGEDKTEPNDEVEEAAEEPESEWEQIQAKVEQELQEDADSSRDLLPSEEPPTGALESISNWPAEQMGDAPRHASYMSWRGEQRENLAASLEQDDVTCGNEGKLGSLDKEFQGKENDDAEVEQRGGLVDDESRVGCMKVGEPEERIPCGTVDGHEELGFQEPDKPAPNPTETATAAIEEGGAPTKVEDSLGEADTEWLKEVGEQQQELVQQSDDRELLAMTLSIRNKVDGRYVLRPENLTKRNSWTIEYSLAEVSSASRAWSLYGACQTRRKKALDSGDGRDEDVAANYYLGLMRSLSKAGRAWRKKQSKIDSESGRDKIVLDQSTSTTPPEGYK